MPNALPSPDGDVVLIDSELIREAIEASRQSDRGRMILPLHRSRDETFHRMFNVIQPGSYIRPHRHLSPPKPETVLVLRGALTFVGFTDKGEVDTVHRLTAEGPVGVDVRPGVYHTLIATEEDTVIFEAKPGPYNPTDDKAFAEWAPDEGSAEAEVFLEGLVGRVVGG